MEIARENIGQALAVQDYGSRIYAQGGSKRVALKTPNRLTPDQKDSIKEIWDAKYNGVEKLHELAFLDGGAELVEVGMNPEEAQMVQTMKFKIEEICRIYNVPLHMVQSLDHATNNNIEHQGIQFVTYTMMPHYKNFEEELDFKLFEPQSNKYTKHNTNALMRGDMKAESEYFRTMSDIGVYSINDIKRIKDENPIAEGDAHLVQLNRVPVEKMNDLTGNTLRMLAEEAVKRATNGNGHKKVETS
jgi:HK97 family phage portal protein